MRGRGHRAHLNRYWAWPRLLSPMKSYTAISRLLLGLRFLCAGRGRAGAPEQVLGVAQAAKPHEELHCNL